MLTGLILQKKQLTGVRSVHRFKNTSIFSTYTITLKTQHRMDSKVRR